MNNPCTFYVVRHGETEWNKKGLLQGHSGSDLTEEGITQATNVAKAFKTVPFSAIFSSDLLRAKRTAEIIALEKQLAIETTKLLREKSFGPFEGKPYSAMKEIDTILEQLTDAEKFSYKAHPLIESDEEIISRFITFLREIAIRYGGKNVLMVTHGSIMRAFLIHIGFATYQSLAHGKSKIGNTAYITVRSDGVEFEVVKTVGVNKAKP